MELGVEGTMTEALKAIIAAKDIPTIIKMFKELILKAYGEKSADGKYFKKSKEISEAFSQTEAYVQLYMELSTNDEAAAEFINGLMPADLVAEAQAEVAKLTGNNSVPAA